MAEPQPRDTGPDPAHTLVELARHLALLAQEHADEITNLARRLDALHEGLRADNARVHQRLSQLADALQTTRADLDSLLSVTEQ